MDGIPIASAQGHSSKPPILRNLWRMDKVDSHLSANPSKEVCSICSSWISWLSSSRGTTAIAKDFERRRVPTENCCNQNWWWFLDVGNLGHAFAIPYNRYIVKSRKSKATSQLQTQVALTSRAPHHHCHPIKVGPAWAYVIYALYKGVKCKSFQEVVEPEFL